MPKGKQGFQKGHKPFKGTEATMFKKGQAPHNKGKTNPAWKFNHSEETIEKIRKSKLELYRDKTRHPSWRGGISKVKEYHTLAARRRQIRKMGNGGIHTTEEWIALKKRYNYICPCCGVGEPKIKLVRDHVVALYIGGTDDIDNIQPLCISCNAKKHIKTIFYSSNKTLTTN